MVKNRLSFFQRRMIVSLHDDNKKTASQIARDIGCSRPTVIKWIKKYQKIRDVQEKSRQCRPRKVTPKIRRAVIREMKGKLFRSTRLIAKRSPELFKEKISRSSVRRILHDSVLKFFHRHRQPHLTDAHRRARLKFAHRWKDKSFDNVIFSDEKHWILYGRPNPHNDGVWTFHCDDVPGVDQEKYEVSLDTWGAVCSRDG